MCKNVLKYLFVPKYLFVC